MLNTDQMETGKFYKVVKDYNLENKGYKVPANTLNYCVFAYDIKEAYYTKRVFFCFSPYFDDVPGKYKKFSSQKLIPITLPSDEAFLEEAEVNKDLQKDILHAAEIYDLEDTYYQAYREKSEVREFLSVLFSLFFGFLMGYIFKGLSL